MFENGYLDQSFLTKKEERNAHISVQQIPSKDAKK
jgi:hypothetical protein